MSVRCALLKHVTVLYTRAVTCACAMNVPWPSSRAQTRCVPSAGRILRMLYVFTSHRSLLPTLVYHPLAIAYNILSMVCLFDYLSKSLVCDGHAFTYPLQRITLKIYGCAVALGTLSATTLSGRIFTCNLLVHTQQLHSWSSNPSCVLS